MLWAWTPLWLYKNYTQFPLHLGFQNELLRAAVPNSCWHNFIQSSAVQHSPHLQMAPLRGSSRRAQANATRRSELGNPYFVQGVGGLWQRSCARTPTEQTALVWRTVARWVSKTACIIWYRDCFLHSENIAVNTSHALVLIFACGLLAYRIKPLPPSCIHRRLVWQQQKWLRVPLVMSCSPVCFPP